MRELQWNFNNNNINHHHHPQQHHHQHHHRQHQQQQTEIMERQSVDEPWLSSEFSQLTRKQQNCEIYRVVASAVLSMSNEVSAAKIRLNELIRRRDDIERELVEAETRETQETQESVMNNNQMR